MSNNIVQFNEEIIKEQIKAGKLGQLLPMASRTRS